VARAVRTPSVSVRHDDRMLIRRERAGDETAIRGVTAAAFDRADGRVPAEAPLVDALRADIGWIPELSLVAMDDQAIIGHVVCTRASVDGMPAIGLGPLSVSPPRQGHGVGSALMHAVLGAADALGEPAVVLLGNPAYYDRFGFRPSGDHGITPQHPEWAPYFQVRTLSAYRPELRGMFAYAAPFDDLET
jgi:putative acetyltransferase